MIGFVGLTRVSVSVYIHSNTIEDGQAAASSRRRGRRSDALDERVNSRLLCLHGQRSLKAKGGAVTAVAAGTWALIRSLYPAAVEMRADQEVGVAVYDC